MYYADGSATARVLSTPGSDAHWSPDGRWIAYRQGIGSRGKKVMLANGDGSGARQIFRGVGVVGWSPDGQHLLVRRSSWAYRILRISQSGQISGRRAMPARPGTRYGSVAWASPTTLIAAGSVRGKNVVVQVKLGGPRPRILTKGRADLIAANASGMVLLRRDMGAVVRFPGGRTVGVGKGAFALTPSGRVLAVRNAPGRYLERQGRLVEINPRRGSTRVIRDNVRSAGASHDGKVIAVQHAARDREGGFLWAITTIDLNRQDIKHLAIVGYPDGEPATVGSVGDSPRTTPMPSTDGQRALIQTPFQHGG